MHALIVFIVEKSKWAYFVCQGRDINIPTYSSKTLLYNLK